MQFLSAACLTLPHRLHVPQRKEIGLDYVCVWLVHLLLPSHFELSDAKQKSLHHTASVGSGDHEFQQGARGHYEL